MKIHAGMMTQNELTDLVPNVERLLPHVDTVNVVDGGSQDLTVMYMRNWAQEDPRVRFFIHPWQDNFPAQRNNYLARIAEVASPGDWIVCLDPDELLDEEAASQLRNLASTADSIGCNIVGFRCHGVSLKGSRQVHRSNDDYWKRFLIRWDPNFRYIHSGPGPVHEGYAGIPLYIVDTGKHPAFPVTYWYEHRKQENMTWIRGCFVPGTPVFTPREMKKIEAIKPGDKVLDMYGNPKTVTEVFTRQVSEDIYRISIPGSTDILCTKEHPWFVGKGSNCHERGKESLAFPRPFSKSCKCCQPDLDYPDTEFGWKKALDLNTLDIMRFPRPRFSPKARENIFPIETCFNVQRAGGGNQYTGVIPKTVPFCEDIAFLCGLYLAEGHIETNSRICFSMNEDEKETWGQELSEIIERKLQRSSWYHKKQNSGKGTILETCVKGLDTWLSEHFDYLAENKKLPYYFVTGSTVSELRALIRGLYTGDGSIKHGLQISLTSPHITMGLYLALARLGYRPSWEYLSLELLNNGNSGAQHKLPMYRINILKQEQGRFRREILGIADTLDENCAYSFAKWVSPESIKSGIISVTKEHYTGPVYNIEVEDTHSYLVPGGTSHNCRNMWIGGGGPNGMHVHLGEWQRLRGISMTLGLGTWRAFYAYLLAGNIDTSIKDWMIQHRQQNGWDGASEFREAYKTYFRILHPEEEPLEFRGESIP